MILRNVCFAALALTFTSLAAYGEQWFTKKGVTPGPDNAVLGNVKGQYFVSCNNTRLLLSDVKYQGFAVSPAPANWACPKASINDTLDTDGDTEQQKAQQNELKIIKRLFGHE